jgi:hypothetical protein
LTSYYYNYIIKEMFTPRSRFGQRMPELAEDHRSVSASVVLIAALALGAVAGTVYAGYEAYETYLEGNNIDITPDTPEAPPARKTPGEPTATGSIVVREFTLRN